MRVPARHIFFRFDICLTKTLMYSGKFFLCLTKKYIIRTYGKQGTSPSITVSALDGSTYTLRPHYPLYPLDRTTLNAPPPTHPPVYTLCRRQNISHSPSHRSLVTMASELTRPPNFYLFHLILIHDNSRNSDRRNVIRFLAVARLRSALEHTQPPIQ